MIDIPMVIGILLTHGGLAVILIALMVNEVIRS